MTKRGIPVGFNLYLQKIRDMKYVLLGCCCIVLAIVAFVVFRSVPDNWANVVMTPFLLVFFIAVIFVSHIK